MGIVLYFSLGVLNIVLLFLLTDLYKRGSGINLLTDSTSEKAMNVLVYFISGLFGTVALAVLGLWLLWLWVRYYKNKKEE